MPLELYWNGHDNFTTATAQGEKDAKAKGYDFIRIEGYVFRNPQSNTVPLRQYLSDERHDYMLLGKALSKTLNKNAHYQLVRIEGYAYAGLQPDTVPLVSGFIRCRAATIFPRPPHKGKVTRWRRDTASGASRLM